MQHEYATRHTQTQSEPSLRGERILRDRMIYYISYTPLSEVREEA
jgi:hypothetical protein